jgi:hypothetical protein
MQYGTFTSTQVSVNHKVSYPKKGDFMVDEKYIFEVGGYGKTGKQLEGIENGFIFVDDIDFPVTK